MKRLTLTTIILSSISMLQAQTSWDLSGNSVTGSDFLGTTNIASLILKTKNIEALRIDTNQNVGIGTLPGARLTVANGTPITSPSFFNSPVDWNTIAIYGSVDNELDSRKAVVGHIQSDGGSNVAGFFYTEANDVSDQDDGINNIGAMGACMGNGTSENIQLNVGVVGMSQGYYSNNVGGFFRGVSSCEGDAASAGIIVSASGGVSRIGIIASTDPRDFPDDPGPDCTLEDLEEYPAIKADLAALFYGNTVTLGTPYVLSDARLKKNKEEIKNASDILQKIKSYQYEYNNSASKNISSIRGTQIGLLAQEIEEVLPHAVIKIQTPELKSLHSNSIRPSEEIYAVNYQEFIPLLISAFNEKQEESDSLKEEVEKQALVIDQLAERLNALENRLNNICSNGCPGIQQKDDAPLNQRSEGFRYYPNPTNSKVQLDIDNLRSDGEYFLNVYSSNGQLVYSKRVINQNVFQDQLDTSSWATGSYTISLNDKTRTIKSGTLMVTR